MVELAPDDPIHWTRKRAKHVVATTSLLSERGVVEQRTGKQCGGTAKPHQSTTGGTVANFFVCHKVSTGKVGVICGVTQISPQVAASTIRGAPIARRRGFDRLSRASGLSRAWTQAHGLLGRGRLHPNGRPADGLRASRRTGLAPGARSRDPAGLSLGGWFACDPCPCDHNPGR